MSASKLEFARPFKIWSWSDALADIKRPDHALAPRKHRRRYSALQRPGQPIQPRHASRPEHRRWLRSHQQTDVAAALQLLRPTTMLFNQIIWANRPRHANTGWILLLTVWNKVRESWPWPCAIKADTLKLQNLLQQSAHHRHAETSHSVYTQRLALASKTVA